MNAPELCVRDVSDPAQSALLADLYQLTMLQAYDAAGMNAQASFQLFCRRLPARRGFIMAAGLEPAPAWLESLQFRPHELNWLANTGRFSQSLIKKLGDFRFTGEVCAVPEGTVVF